MLAPRPCEEEEVATIQLAQLLSRVSEQLERTAASISRVEASLCVLVGQVSELPTHLIHDLQEIDLAHQHIFDISRVVQLSADASHDGRVNIRELEQAIKVRDLAIAFLWPDRSLNEAEHLDQDDPYGMSWL